MRATEQSQTDGAIGPQRAAAHFMGSTPILLPILGLTPQALCLRLLRRLYARCFAGCMLAASQAVCSLLRRLYACACFAGCTIASSHLYAQAASQAKADYGAQ